MKFLYGKVTSLDVMKNKLYYRWPGTKNEEMSSLLVLESNEVLQ